MSHSIKNTSFDEYDKNLILFKINIYFFSCFCNLHAKYCTRANGTTRCECAHNTDGQNCEICKPLYNNRPWKPGNYLPYPSGTANECQSKYMRYTGYIAHHGVVAIVWNSSVALLSLISW